MDNVEKFISILESLEGDSNIISHVKEATRVIFEAEESAFGPGGKYRKEFLVGIAAYRDGNYNLAATVWWELLNKVSGTDKYRLAKYLHNIYKKISSLSEEDNSNKIDEMNEIIYEFEKNA